MCVYVHAEIKVPAVESTIRAQKNGDCIRKHNHRSNRKHCSLIRSYSSSKLISFSPSLTSAVSPEVFCRLYFVGM